MRTTLVVGLMCGLGGCIGPVRFVVVADVPTSPTFTVIPASTSSDDNAAANRVTEVLVGLGIHVIERPALVKQRTEYTGQSSGAGVGVTLSGNLAVGGVGGSQSGDVVTSIDPIAAIQETQADYVVFAKSGPWLKVVKRKDGQIMFAGSLAWDNNSGCCLNAAFWSQANPDRERLERERLRDLLRKMGVTK